MQTTNPWIQNHPNQLHATGAERRMRKHRAPVGPVAGREGTRPGPTTMSQDLASLRRDTWAVVGESASELFAAKGEAASVLFAAEGEATAGDRGMSRRSDPGCGQGDPGRSRSGAERSFQARRRGRCSRGPQRSRLWSRRPGPVTERGGESFQARRQGRCSRGGHGQGWSVQAEHGRGRGGPGWSRPGKSVRADHGGDEAPVPGPAGG